MKKIQFFIIIEVILLMVALLDIMSSDFTRFVVLVFLIFLAIRFYLGQDKVNLMLTSSALLLFFVIMSNLFINLFIIVAVIYMMLNYFSRIQKRENYQSVKIDQAPRRVKRERMQWFGNQDHFDPNRTYPFDDVNIVRVFGNDVIDLTEVAMAGADNVIIVHKSFGTTRLVVPVGVEVDLTAAAIYGHLDFLDLIESDLRNESVKFQSHHFLNANKRVKVVVNVLFGDIEVSRQ